MSNPQKMIVVPLSQLILSPRNVRKKPEPIDELAADLLQHGQLQNLIVTKGAGGKYNVEAGGQRFRAFKKLEEDTEIQPDHEVFCLLIDDANPTEISLAENFQRTPMHPADQFEAFQAIADQGKSVADIASSFGVHEVFVRQRLKLANVAPSLVQTYRDGKMNLECLQAFAISNDKKQQERLWTTLPDWQRKPSAIIAALTKSELNAAHDKHAKLVGVERYKAAGGAVRRDLFSTEVFFADAALVQKLARELIEDHATRLRGEGWKWVTLFVKGDHLSLHDYGRKKPKTLETTPEQDRELAAIAEKRLKLEAELAELPEDNYGDPLDRLKGGELGAYIDELDIASESIRGELLQWSPKVKAESGAILELTSAGRLAVHRGLVSKSDAKEAAKAASKPKPKGAQGTEHSSAPAALSDAMCQTLTGHRSAVIASKLAWNDTVMLAVLTNALMGDLNHNGYTTRLGDFRASQSQSNHVRASVPDDYPARAETGDLKAGLLKAIPEPAEARMAYLLNQSQDELLGILGVIVANAFEGITGSGPNGNGGGNHRTKLALVEQVATALRVDMADHWEATRETYFARVPKELMIAAVTEACGAAPAKTLGPLKKGDAAAKAEELIAGKRWLPKPLRMRAIKPAPPVKKGSVTKAPAKPAKVAPAKKASRKRAGA